MESRLKMSSLLSAGSIRLTLYSGKAIKVIKCHSKDISVEQTPFEFAKIQFLFILRTPLKDPGPTKKWKTVQRPPVMQLYHGNDTQDSLKVCDWTSSTLPQILSNLALSRSSKSQSSACNLFIVWRKDTLFSYLKWDHDRSMSPKRYRDWRQGHRNSPYQGLR